MSDVELARIAGVSKEAIGQFINKTDRQGGGLRFRINKIHEALGLEVKVERTFAPKVLPLSDTTRRTRTVEDWTLARPRPNRPTR